MTTYGITPTGFVRKTEEVLFEELLARVRGEISPSLDGTPNSIIGRIIGIVAAERAEDWEVMEATYNSQWETSGDQSLDNVCAITGTTRDAATYSTVTCDVNMNSGTAVSAGQILASVDGNPDAVFANVSAFTAPSTGSHSLEFIATQTGPVQAPAGTLTNLDAPVPSGVNSITNAADATPGEEIESDTALRVKRRAELTAQGTGTDDAIQADVLRVADVEDVQYLVNRNPSPDGNGLPAHSFEVVVYGGDDDDLAQAIWDTMPSGIRAFGSTSGTATDAADNSQTVAFSRPTEKRVYLEIDVTVDADTYGGDAEVAAAVAQFSDGSLVIDLGDGNELGGQLGVGDDVILAKLYSAIYTVSGVLDVTEIRAGFSASPVGTVNLSIGVREIVSNGVSAGIDSADILVTSS